MSEPVTDPQHPNRERLDALFRSDAYAGKMGVELLDWGGGWSRVRWTPEEQDENFGGVVHGGAVFSAGDVAFSIASNSWGRRAVALTVDTHFLGAPTPGLPVEAIGRERKRTRRTASYLIEVTAEGAAIASLHAMVYRLSDWFFGIDAWPADWLESH